MNEPIHVTRRGVLLGLAFVAATAVGFGLAVKFPSPPEPAAWSLPGSVIAPAAGSPASTHRSSSPPPPQRPSAVELDLPDDPSEVARFLDQKTRSLARADPASAILTANAHASGIALARLYRGICREWAAHDYRAALEWCRNLGPDSRPLALEGVVASLAEADPESAEGLFLGLPDSDRTAPMAEAIANAVFIGGDLHASIALLQHTDDDLRERAWQNIIKFSKHHPERALELLENPDPSFAAHRAENLVLQISATAFPERALAELLEGDPFPGREWLVRSALESLARSDLRAAVTLIDGLPDNLREASTGADLVQALAYETKYRGYDEFLGAVEHAYDGELPPDVLAVVLREAPYDTPESRAARSRRIIAAARDGLLPSSTDLAHDFSVLYHHDPDTAEDTVNSIVAAAIESPNQTDPGLLHGALTASRYDDPTEAIALAGQVQDERLRPTAIKVALGAHLDQDPVAAARWAGQLAGADLPNNAPQKIADGTRYRDPATSVEWGMQIADDQRRVTSLAESVRVWAVLDPAAARRAVAGLDLPADEVATLTSLINWNP